MDIGLKIRALREHKNLSQEDIEKRSGLLRTYLSRVENGHTVPSLETIEKIARALEMPVYLLFYDAGDKARKPSESEGSNELAWNDSRKDRHFARKLRRLLARMTEQNRKLLLRTAQQMAQRK